MLAHRTYVSVLKSSDVITSPVSASQTSALRASGLIFTCSKLDSEFMFRWNGWLEAWVTDVCSLQLLTYIPIVFFNYAAVCPDDAGVRFLLNVRSAEIRVKGCVLDSRQAAVQIKLGAAAFSPTFVVKLSRLVSAVGSAPIITFTTCDWCSASLLLHNPL